MLDFKFNPELTKLKTAESKLAREEEIRRKVADYNLRKKKLEAKRNFKAYFSKMVKEISADAYLKKVFQKEVRGIKRTRQEANTERGMLSLEKERELRWKQMQLLQECPEHMSLQTYKQRLVQENKQKLEEENHRVKKFLLERNVHLKKFKEQAEK